jgi:hypothetical protein
MYFLQIKAILCTYLYLNGYLLVVIIFWYIQ